MPLITHTCLTLACNVCRAPYESPEEGYLVHFSDVREAASAVQSDGWTVTADGLVYCATRDEEHQAALDALMPPEPTSVPEGQLSLGEETTQ